MPLVLTPQGIPSAEAIGVLQNLQGVTVLPDGIPSEEAIGSPTFSQTVSGLTGIPTGESVTGTPQFVIGGNVVIATDGSGDMTLLVDGVPSQGTTFGQPNLEVGFAPSPERFNRVNAPIRITERYSGIVINQNQTPTEFGFVDLNTWTEGASQYWQEFKLPDSYTRVDNTPPITGFQVFCSVRERYEDFAAIDWTLQRYDLSDAEWQTLDSGTGVSSPHSGDVWFSMYAKNPIEINPSWVADTFRVGFQGRSSTSERVEEVVEYDAGQVDLDGNLHHVPLEVGIPYHTIRFDATIVSNNNPVVILAQDTPTSYNGEAITIDDSEPVSFFQDPATNLVYYSVEQGVLGLYASNPNPLETQGVMARDSALSPLLIDGEESSLMFRVLSGVADSGTDFLGNAYRSAIYFNEPDVLSFSSENQNKTWLSKPNPSRFAVESLYFDVTNDQGAAQVIDRVLIDPTTPGIYCNIYYSINGIAGTTEQEWNNKLWTRVPEVFHLERKETFALPIPILAKYIKIEFSHLQPRWYAPGMFTKPVLYKKHPKWVLDYFLARLAAEQTGEDHFPSREIELEYDLYDFAYNYYLDDMRQEPLSPTELGMNEAEINELQAFLKQRSGLSDAVDTDTARRIQNQMFPYTRYLRGKSDYLLSTFTFPAESFTQSGEKRFGTDVPLERLQRLNFTSTDVSVLDRDRVVQEKGFPVMFYFVPCRHQYRELSADFTHDRAYFAGIQQVAFMRENYTADQDQDIYIEIAGDQQNVEQGDFISTGHVWSTYDNS